MNNDISQTDRADFIYLLELMPLLGDTPEYAWLPELLSIIGYDKLLLLCKYCGGEVIRIPHINELIDDIDSLRWYYQIYLAESKSIKDCPNDLKDSVRKLNDILSEKFRSARHYSNQNRRNK